MIRFTSRRAKAAFTVSTVAAIGALVLSQAGTGHGAPTQAAGATRNGTVNIALAADTAGSTSPSEDPQFVNTFGEYISGHPVDINSANAPCYPSVPGCPQYPLVPDTYGWQNCEATDDLTDGCGYLFDNSTSSQIVRSTINDTAGGLATLCPGLVAVLCGALSAEVGKDIGDHQQLISPGRCLYLHAPDFTDVWNLTSPLPSIVQARIVDCP
jgi:hypothetical protein